MLGWIITLLGLRMFELVLGEDLGERFVELHEELWFGM